MPPDTPPAALRLAVDADALAANWRTLDSLSRNAAAAAAVKADAYGLGVAQAVPVLAGAGCRDFLVAHWSEVADVLEHAAPTSISVLHGPMNQADCTYARATGVRPVINSPAQARRWLDSGGGPCDVMIDTGINRLGIVHSDISDDAVQSLDIDVLMSHLASADEDVALNAQQCEGWEDARKALPHRRASLANSAGIVLGERYHGDLTRPGLSLYGGVPRKELKGSIRQVARPLAAVIQVRDIAPGDGVGYNSTFVAERPMRIGTIALGYADGYLRCWSGGVGTMRHAGRQLPVLGRVSMDMTVIDLSNAPDVREGDWVEAEYSLPEASAASGLSQYELLSVLADRFAR